MPKVLVTEQRMPIILSVLDCWQGKLTWELYAMHIANRFGEESISRFTLERYPEIKSAYQLAKNRLRSEREKPRCDEKNNITIEFALKQIQELHAKMERVEQEKKALQEQFVRWQKNAYMMPGMDIERLNWNMPLPRANRK